ncbi:MAG TPA: cobalamin-dependent protein [Ilumatobacteraceae bacterium]
MGEDQLTLQEVADALGVHYMTAYRYIRLGYLMAEKSAGTWRVTRGDLDQFRSGSKREGLSSGAHHRTAPWAERLEARLVAGDEPGSWSVVQSALAAGAMPDDIYVDVITPALHSIGMGWQVGVLDISVEHRSSLIAQRLIGQLGPRFARRGRTRGSVILGCPAGEQHSIALWMIADQLRFDGWSVSNLGNDVPHSSLRYLVSAAGEDLVSVGLSASTDASLQPLSVAIAAAHSADVDAYVVVGGQAIRDADHAESLGANGYAVDGRGLIELLRNRS